jgi:hypothetical protein
MRHLAYSVRHSLVPVNSSQAGITQTDSLRAGRYGDRIPVEARFSSPVQTGLGALPTSYTMGTGSFPWVKRPRRGVDHPLPSRAEVRERVELYLYSSHGPSWPVIGCTLPLPLTVNSSLLTVALYTLDRTALVYNDTEYLA